jgi:RHS repeat-associated protein
MRRRSSANFATLALTALVAVISISVAVAGLQSPAVADPVTAPVSSPVETDATERPDSVSAMVTARAVRHRVEDTSQRDEFTRVYANPDGTWTSETASEPESVQDEGGVWHEVDTTLVQTDAGWAPTYAPTEMVLSDGGNNTFASLTENGRVVDWRWPSDLPAPAVEGDTATYADALPGGDLVVTATSTGFTHNIVLRERPDGPVEFTIPVATHGADLVAGPAGSLAVETQAGQTVAQAPQPLMWDSSEDIAGQPENVAPVDAAVGQNASGTPTLTLSPDDSFLADPDTVYPVVVDPSFTTYPTGDVWVQNADYTSGQVSSQELRAGTYDGGGHKARSFMHFDTTKWNGKNVLSANLVMRNFYSGSCTGGAIRASRIIDSWNGNTLNWGNQPAVGAEKYDDYSAAKGYTSACPGGDSTWNLEDMVQGWADGFPNHGIRLKAVDEGSIFTWRKYRSANYSGGSSPLRPHITVTYNSFPNKPGTPSVSPGNPGYSTTTTPTLKATVSDPDGGKLSGDFEIHQGSTLIWSSTSNEVSSGSKATETVPAGKLTNGTTYTVKLRGKDGTNNSKSYSASTTFTVDTSKPTANVTASAFTDGQWTTTVPTSNTFTFNGPNDTQSFAYSLDGIAQPAKTANSTGDATASWLPKSGSHTLTVNATDDAGNVGATASFRFGVGAASFTTPTAAARSTGVFPIDMSGPPNATGATLSWRYAGQGSDAWTPLTGVTTTTGSTWSGSVANNSDNSASATPGLLWDATHQEDPASTSDPKAKVTAPALIELQTCFAYSTSPSQVCSPPRQLQLVPTAFGGNFPTTQIGPATVALVTGEMTMTEPDAVDTVAGVGRIFSSFDSATVRSGPFGPGWSTGLISPGETGAELVDNRTKDRTLVLVSAGTASQTFLPLDPTVDPTTATGPVAYVPAGVDDGSRILLDGPTATLTRLDSIVTTWQIDAEGVWSVKEVSTGTNDPDPEVEVGFAAAEYPTWIGQTEPGVVADCSEDVQSPGCRGLKITYAGAGSTTRVTTIERITHNGAVTVAAYDYNTAGQLTRACGPDPDSASAEIVPLCSEYEYIALGGRTLLKSVALPGQKAWQFVYDSTGRLSAVNRNLDNDSTEATGTATWTVAYDLGLSSSELPDLSASAALQWGQARVPTKAFAVFSPAHVPQQPNPAIGDLEYATLWFTDADGTTTNTAVHAASGWLVDSVWYDEHGNVVRTLDAPGRARALAAPTEEGPKLATDASTFISYGADGSRVESEFAPVRTATLKDGTEGQFRAHTEYVYDDEDDSLGGGSKPVLSEGQTSFNLIVEQRRSASGPDQTGEFDVTVVRNEYAPVVTGDANGWEIGTPTKVKTQLDDGSWSTAVTRYDSDGRLIETRQPGGGAGPDGSGTDAHATVISYYEAGAEDSSCDTSVVGRLAWAGQPCKTGPAAQPTGKPIPVTYYASYDADLRPTRIEEISGTTTRIITRSYDVLGRQTSETVAVGNESLTRDTAYDPDTGLPTSSEGASGATSTTHDAWGRVWKYTDGSGLTSTTTYTIDGQVATVSDGEGTYTYTYDGPSGEHRRLATGVDVGVAAVPDSFALSYDDGGDQASITYPNGMVATMERDELGAKIGMRYTDGAGQPLLAFAAERDVDGRIVANSSTASAQSFGLDKLGRLASVQDIRPDVEGNSSCVTRTYAFSEASERSEYRSFDPTPDGSCQTASATVSRTISYDSASRITDPGYAYDDLGRTLTLPAADTVSEAAGPLTANYYANDMVKSLTQAVSDGLGGTVTNQASYSLDSTGRVSSISTSVDGAETSRLRYRFSDSSDVPTSTQVSSDAGATWATTRYLGLPSLGMVGSVTAGSITYLIGNIHGDIVATQRYQAGTPTIDSYSETDEFGNAIGPAVGRYGWLGSAQRSTDAVGGLTLMGVRLYNSVTGSFLSPDPVPGGNSTPYTYPLDPVNQVDLDGKVCVLGWGHCTREAERRTGATVSISADTWQKVTGYHAVPSWLVFRAIWYASPGLFATRYNYSPYKFTVWEWKCTAAYGCWRTTRWRILRIVINWYDGRLNHGWLVSMYCQRPRYKVCDEWIRTAGPYLGPPGPQF